MDEVHDMNTLQIKLTAFNYQVRQNGQLACIEAVGKSHSHCIFSVKPTLSTTARPCRDAPHLTQLSNNTHANASSGQAYLRPRDICNDNNAISSCCFIGCSRPTSCGHWMAFMFSKTGYRVATQRMAQKPASGFASGPVHVSKLHLCNDKNTINLNTMSCFQQFRSLI